MATHRDNLVQTVRSIGVGGVATGVDLAVLTLLVAALSVAPTHANVPALLAGLGVQFVGNKWFAFGNRANDARSLARQGAGFAVVEAGALALNGIGYHLVVGLAPDAWWVARIVVSAAVYLLWSLPLWRRVFRPAAIA